VAAILLNGRDAVRDDLPRRWVHERFLHPRKRAPGYSYTFASGRIDNIDQFDPELFGISPREAVQVDPQQLLLLELTHEALEDAGLAVHTLVGERVGVYVGMSFMDYMSRRSADLASIDGYLVTGGAMSISANRISHAFDFHGPSLVVDTACSSSLVALDLARRALQQGDIDLAIVGGSNLLLDPRPFVGFAQATMLSPTGRCRPFSGDADGFMRAEGCAVLVLRRQDSLGQDDRPRGWLLASGVNSDGHTLGLSLPNGAAQARLLRDTYFACGLSADDLSYFEAHGTGTAVGDPIEAAAIGEALASHRAAPLPVSSAKSSFGHLESASGMVGLFAALTVLEHRRLPQLAHFSASNPMIDFEALGLAPCASGSALPERGRLVVGINSFGFGGTNAHAILSSEPVAPRRRRRHPKRLAPACPVPLLLSARSDAALRALADRWASHLEDGPDADLGATLRGAARGRTLYPHRLVATGPDAPAIAAALRAWLDGEAAPGVVAGEAFPGEIAFVFSGNGSQWAGMGRLALQRNDSFRSAIAALSQRMEPRLGWSVAEELAAADPTRLERTVIAQPVLFAIQVALVEALRAAAIVPSAVIGHSVGEIAAAWTAGALSLEAALDVVICRSRLQQQTWGRGRMAICHVDAETVISLLETHKIPVDIAAYNGARSITVSGRAEHIAAFGRIMEKKEHFFRDLDLDYAFHSQLMDSLADDMRIGLADLSCDQPSINFISTVTGALEPAPTLDAEYWWHNLRMPVRFSEAAQRLAQLDIGLVLEIGPHPVLQSFLGEIRNVNGRRRQVLASLSRHQTEGDPVAEVIAACHANGADISMTAMFDGPRQVRDLPHYPYQRRSIAVTPTVENHDVASVPRVHPLLGFPVGDGLLQWRSHVDLDLEPWLADHMVDGEAFLPAAAMIDMAFAAARVRFPQASGVEVIDLEINRPLVVERESVREFMVRIEPERDRFEISSRPRLADTVWTVHATGRVAALEADPPEWPPPGPGEAVEADRLYAHADALGLQYGPGFRRVDQVIVHDDQSCTTRLVRPDDDALVRASAGMVVDPAWLDAATHGLLALPISHKERRLPWRFGRVRLFASGGGVPACGQVRLRREGTYSAEGDLLIADADGRVLLEVRSVWFVRSAAEPRDSRPGLWTSVLVPVPGTADAPAAASDAGKPVEADVDAGPPADARLLLDACIAAAAHSAVAPLAEQGQIDAVSALLSGAVRREGDPTMRTALAILAEAGFATPEGEGFVLAPPEDVPDWREIWRTLLTDSPDSIGELALLGAVLDDMPRAARLGRADVIAGASQLRDQVLSDGPDGRALIEMLADRVAAIVEAWPAERPLRLLEVGPRAGLLTRALSRRLGAPPVGLFCTLAPTDSDATETARVALNGLPGQVLVWELSEQRPEQIGVRAYDLVVGVYSSLSCQAAGMLALAFAPLVAPGGRLLLAEPLPCWFWHLLAARDDTRFADGPGWSESIVSAGLGRAAFRVLRGQLWGGLVLEAEQTPAVAGSSARTLASPVLIAAAVDDPLAVPLAGRLQSSGIVPARVTPDSLAAALAGEIATVLLLAGDSTDPTTVLVSLAAAADALAAASALQLVLISRGEARGEPAAHAIEGAVRVLGNECRTLSWRILRVSRDYDSETAAAEILAALGDGDAEAEVLLAPASRLVPRIRPLPQPVTTGRPAILAIGQRGRIDSLHWQELAPPVPGDGEVVIETEAAGLNFRDLMWSLGLLPDEALMDGFAGPALGLECAGRISAVGAGVTRFAPGDRVVALAPAALASHVRTMEAACMKLPDWVDFASAATLPVAFMTVCYSLGTLAQLAPGERVLIHAAAGGVGLAAVQYALHRGAEVIATAGSPVKRAVLRLLGVRHVLDSRSLVFADDVLRLTDGRGVDVVLNSLSGKAMERSLEVIAPLGRFVELGKRDFLTDTAVGLRPLRRNVSYFGVDLDHVARARPERMEALFAEVAALLAAGAIRPLPYRALGFDAVRDAFRIMSGAGHVGKLVLARDRGPPPVAMTPERFAADPAGTYVVTGGLAGFGLESARWLADRGARHLALLGRRGEDTPGAAEAIRELAALGCDARAWRCDVSDRSAISATLDRVRAEQAPIVGVLHAAMVLRDGMLPGLDEASFRAVLEPKYWGAEWLDELTANDDLSVFIMFSSVSALLGSPGQANYVAANAAIEAIVERRRLAGKPGLAVAWGPIGDAGVLTRQGETAQVVTRRTGGHLLAARTALDSLDTMLGQPASLVAAASVRWSDARSALRGLGSARFAEVLSGLASDVGGEDQDLRAMVAALPPEEALALVQARLVETIGKVLLLPASSITEHTRLHEIGLDSMMVVELGLAIEERLAVKLSRTAISELTSVGTLTAAIVKALGGAAPAEDDFFDVMSRRYEGDTEDSQATTA
jgi:acyl transferase domain-containing protein/NADPH:quinone reductase-like Zn-dependent oxidoreductase/acyl carrier protein